jgi:hypothetical protein
MFVPLSLPCYSLLFQGRPCRPDREFLPPETPPTPPPPKPISDWTPFKSRTGFELAEVLYVRAAVSNDNIDRLLDLWKATLVPYNDSPPILDHTDLHSTIDLIELGSVPWQSYTIQYNGLRPEDAPTPKWMTTEYQLWYRDPRKVIHNILGNPDLVNDIDYVSYPDPDDGKCRYCDFMSSDWAWKQSVSLMSERLLCLLTMP